MTHPRSQQRQQIWEKKEKMQNAHAHADGHRQTDRQTDKRGNAEGRRSNLCQHPEEQIPELV